MSRAEATQPGPFEDLVTKLTYHELSDLPPRTKMALRLADEISLKERPEVDGAFYAELREHFDDDQILDLGMCIAFVCGWQRFIEAFGIVPDKWADGDQLPWAPGDDDADDPAAGPGPD